MKKVRIVALLIALVMIFAVSAASAGTMVWGKGPVRQNSKIMGNLNYRFVSNGETVNLMTFPYPWTLFEKDTDGSMNAYSDIWFSFDGKLTAKSSVSWIKITEVDDKFLIDIADNTSAANRKGKVTVSGKGYKATLNFTQTGVDKISSVKRSGNKVTVTFKPGKSPTHVIWIEESKWDEEDQSNTYKTLLEGLCNKKKVTFKVRAGYNYNINYGPAFVVDNGGYYSNGTAWCYFYVESTSGSESYNIEQ